MAKKIVTTVTGPDRIGIVDHVTELLLRSGGNVESSRMARLEGIFAMLLLVTVADERYEAFSADMKALEKDDYIVTIRKAENADPSKFRGWVPYSLRVNGADHTGIIHQVAHFLASRRVNVEDMETEVVPAPMSGTPLFRMEARLLASPETGFADLRRRLNELCDELGVDIEINAL